LLSAWRKTATLNSFTRPCPCDILWKSIHQIYPSLSAR
jgi:hypothetical protein